MKKTINVDVTYVGMRIDRFLRKHFEAIPQSLIERNLRSGKIKLNKKKIKSSTKLKINDAIEIQYVNKDFIKDDFKQSRIISGEIQLKKKKIELINIYVPNGNPIETEKYEYKKNWLKKFTIKLKMILKQYMQLLLVEMYSQED